MTCLSSLLLLSWCALAPPMLHSGLRLGPEIPIVLSSIHSGVQSAKAAVEEGRYAEAIPMLEHIYRDPSQEDWPSACVLLARCYRHTALAERIADIVTSLLDQSVVETAESRAWSIESALASTYQWNGQNAAAYDRLLESSARFPSKRPEVLLRLLDAAQRAQRHLATAKHGEQLIAEFPALATQQRTIFVVIEAKRLSGDITTAISLCDSQLNAPANIRVHAEVVKAELIGEYLRDYASANSLLETIINRDEDPYETYLAKYQLGWNLLNRQHDYAGARVILLAALPSFPKDNLATEIAGWIGCTYASEGQHLQAIEWFKRAVSDYPSPVASCKAWTLYMAAQSARRVGNRSEYIAMLTQCASISEPNTWTSKATSELRRINDDTEGPKL